MKKNKKSTDEDSQVNEPSASYHTHKITIFSSFEDQEAHSIKEMAKLSPVETLTQLRLLINLAYGLNELNPKKSPAKHSLHSIGYIKE